MRAFDPAFLERVDQALYDADDDVESVSLGQCPICGEEIIVQLDEMEEHVCSDSAPS